jgi:hypothetical protein
MGDQTMHSIPREADRPGTPPHPHTPAGTPAGEWPGLPMRSEPWPKFGTRRLVDLSGDGYDVSREEARAAAGRRPWVWPDRPIVFLCDLHADAEAFQRSLAAAGVVRGKIAEDADSELTSLGRQALILIGGDCLDKGPDNLQLLRSIHRLGEQGAEVEILAGNHDLRVLMALAHGGRREPLLAHLFVRQGRKCLPLLQEALREIRLAGGQPRPADEEQARRALLPDETWYREFPRAAAGLLLPERIEAEVRRIREKSADLEERLAVAGLSPGLAWTALEACRRLFLHPGGEFRWFFQGLRLARRSGSFIRRAGVEALNRQFRQLMREDLFHLYHSPIGNACRTKYRRSDFPFTAWGARDLTASGIYALVHGHENLRGGQRLAVRRGLLDFQCDASVDAGTRVAEGLPGPGFAATVFYPDGTLRALSADYPYVKLFDAAEACGMTTITDRGRAVA